MGSWRGGNGIHVCTHLCVCVCVCVHVEKVGAAFPPWIVSKQPFLSFHLSPFKPIFSAFFYSQTTLEKLRQPQMRFHGRMCRGGVCCSICSFSLIPISSHTCSPSFPLGHLPFKIYSKISKYSIFILWESIAPLWKCKGVTLSLSFPMSKCPYFSSQISWPLSTHTHTHTHTHAETHYIVLSINWKETWVDD